jgi:2-desacetyl-2-hydroxyethyl bacteriochlorophyllide A dehydrogenase
MHSIICLKPGELVYREETYPVPRPGEVILKMTHLGICGTDLHAYEGHQPFFEYPRILGHELSAVIADRNGADGIENGEQVTIMPYFYCGQCIACRKAKTNCCVNLKVFGVHIDGGMKEYISVPVYAIIKSSGLTGEQLALVEPFAIGAHGIRRAEISVKDTVLVMGAGPIGLGTIMMAKRTGARVISMDISAERLGIAANVARADEVIDPIAENVPEKLRELTDGNMPDVVIDATGNRKAINAGFSYISHGGKYVLIGLQKEEVVVSHPEFHKREATLMSSARILMK